MNALFAAAADVQSFCVGRRWKCSVIGGLAVQRWGDPRQTRDVDLTLLTGLGGEEHFIDPILAHYVGRVPEARQLTIERRVLLVETHEGVPVDIALGGLPFEARVIAVGARPAARDRLPVVDGDAFDGSTINNRVVRLTERLWTRQISWLTNSSDRS